MTKEEKLQFVQVHTDSISKEILADIISERIPDNWDGIELRKLIADRFSQSVMCFYGPENAKRAREYKNTALIKGL